MIAIVRMILAAADPAARRRLWRGLAWTVAEGVFAVLPLVVLAAVFARIVHAPATPGEVAAVAGTLVALLAAQVFCAARGGRAVHGAAYAMTASLRHAVIDHLGRLPLGLVLSERVGALADAATDKIQLLEQMLSSLLGHLAAVAVTPVILLVLLALVDPLTAVVLAAGLPVAVAAALGVERLFLRRTALRMDLAAEAAAALVEYVHTLKTMRLMGAAGQRRDAVISLFRRLRDQSIGLEMLAGTAIGLFAAGVETAFVAALALGAVRLGDGTLDLAAFAAVAILGARWYEGVTRAAVLRMQMLYMARGGERVRDILTTPALAEGTLPLPPEARAAPEVEIRDLVFTHPRAATPRPTLSGLTLTLAPGSFTALVGPSGAGKTTLAHLIARFHDVDAGSIAVAGRDVRALPAEDLLSMVSLVFQDVYLFNTTIGENIRIARPDADEAAVLAAAEAAAVHEFVRTLPEGYDTVVGEGGHGLSGGERQRIAIARALLADAPILLLDEATAALDPVNAAAVQRGLDRLTCRRTLLVVAHRLASVAAADRIVVLDHGRIVESGRHDDLLARPGPYRTLWQAEVAAGAGV